MKIRAKFPIKKEEPGGSRNYKAVRKNILLAESNPGLTNKVFHAAEAAKTDGQEVYLGKSIGGQRFTVFITSSFGERLARRQALKSSLGRVHSRLGGK